MEATMLERLRTWWDGEEDPPSIDKKIEESSMGICRKLIQSEPLFYLAIAERSTRLIREESDRLLAQAAPLGKL
jgi:hypothetical protein